MVLYLFHLFLSSSLLVIVSVFLHFFMFFIRHVQPWDALGLYWPLLAFTGLYFLDAHAVCAAVEHV